MFCIAGGISRAYQCQPSILPVILRVVIFRNVDVVVLRFAGVLDRLPLARLYKGGQTRLGGPRPNLQPRRPAQNMPAARQLDHRPGNFALVLLPVAGIAVAAACVGESISGHEATTALIGAIVMFVLCSFGFIMALVYGILVQISLGRVFAKNSGFIVGLIFLPLIFLAILAFDSSKYICARPPVLPTIDASATTTPRVRC